jgi:signal transduction histidine kinase
MILQRYFGSMTGRLFVFLLIGVIGSASVALGIADARRRTDLQRIRMERLVDRVQDFIAFANNASATLRPKLMSGGVPGLYPASGAERIVGVDTELTQRLASRIGGGVRAQRVASSTCFSRPMVPSSYNQLSCWAVAVQLADGTPLKLIMISPRTEDWNLPGLDPVFLSILALGVGVLTFIAARMAAAPLGDLSRAARTLGGDLDSVPLPERGPYEVRHAIRAFNTMQARLRRHVVERTQILASITHDLQTPLTRLRLRLEKVEDIALRSRLVDDLSGMQLLIREGLDFSRGSQIDEPFAPIALDSLLESLVEDATERGQTATLTGRCGYDVEARPRALQRCLANLLDNALKYGGSAEIAATVARGELRITVRDHGPGIPVEKLNTVFEPFVRLELPGSRSTEGAGLGLTIARMLAQKNEADLLLDNHPEGGLEACLILRRGLAQQRLAAVFESRSIAHGDMNV